MTDNELVDDHGAQVDAGDRVLVDFDNTLTEGDVAYWEGERPDPDDDVVDAVNECYFAGCTVIIWTARPWSEAARLAAHLTEWGVRWHGLRCDKGSGDVYVDDKALRPDTFADATSN
ncbi:capsular biosynthesis protein [Haloferax sp. Atlit-6N]|uniref:capsular biosynthesis protein n=1 Tax=Haloferax sp. Atlit-6N TaxID=2077205 RepID=UPI000E2391C6|nr:capsular biosynthesis protein [Haloferax sp. Atlit-6N]REA00237.1 capsular biosynthesis protein [Haloferax sp. Atlit-6N]